MRSAAWGIALPLLLLLLLLPGAARGQAPTQVWLGFGLGGGATTVFAGGLGGVTRLAVEHSGHHVELRVSAMSDFSLFPDGGDGSVGDVGLLYGRVGANSVASWHYAAGPGLGWTDPCSGSDGSGCYSPALLMTAGAALQSPVIALGLSLFVNLNPKASFIGLAIELRLGWIPGR